MTQTTLLTEPTGFAELTEDAQTAIDGGATWIMTPVGWWLTCYPYGMPGGFSNPPAGTHINCYNVLVRNFPWGWPIF
ncbi:MAG: hypothetical protein FWF75_02140 [Propionibacteriaceae bacterium]|nr:hypothetical protein [Propionibacteriaceae bacterium]